MSSICCGKNFCKKQLPRKSLLEQEIQDSFDERTKNKGKYEFDYNEVLFLNDLPELEKIQKNGKF